MVPGRQTHLHSPGCHQRSSLGPCLASHSSWSACYVPSPLSLALETSTVWPQSPCTATSHTSVSQCPGLQLPCVPSPPMQPTGRHHLYHLSPLLLAPALPPALKALHPCYGMACTPWSLPQAMLSDKVRHGLHLHRAPQPPPLRGPGRFLPELLTPKSFPYALIPFQVLIRLSATSSFILYCLCIGMIPYWLFCITFSY